MIFDKQIKIYFMKKCMIIVLLLLAARGSFAQSVAGDWYGSLNMKGTLIPIIYHIVKNGDTFVSTMDSPDQGALGLATDKTTFLNNQITIEASKYNIKYSGSFIPDSNKIKGFFTRGTVALPLDLSNHKVNSTAPPQEARPQDPKDFPYKQEDVMFLNPRGGNRLAGTLTIPVSGHVSKIVILITGSGPQNRNEEVKAFNHRPFLVWSDWLTRQGIAVLRYDDRGIGQSTGNFMSSTTADFADDAEAAVKYIKSRSDLKDLSIGLMGHSEGGMIAPVVASRNKDVKFIILLAGPAVPIVQLMIKQSDDQMRLGGASEEARKLSDSTDMRLYTFVNEHPNLPAADLKIKIDTLLYRDIRKYPVADLGGKSIAEIVKENDMQVISPWFRYFIAFKPADYLMKVKCPLLAINGTLDMQVNSKANLGAIKTAMEIADNQHYKVIPLTDLNHLFQKAKTGAVTEYGQISETVNPLALQTVSNWINQL